MAAGDTDVKIASDAMILLGVAEIASFGDGSTRGGIAENLYPFVRDQLLSMYRWSFSMKKQQLANSTSTGVASINSGWEMLGADIVTDQTVVVIDYQFTPLEAQMPTYFVNLLKTACAMYFAEPMTDQISKAMHWERVAFGNPAEGGRGGLFRQAAGTDGMGTPTSFINDFPLIDTRLTLSDTFR